MVDFGEAIRMFYNNYVNFSGRSQRSEYWWVQLFFFIIYFIVGFLIVVIGGGLSSMSGEGSMNGIGVLLAILFGVFALANLLPGIALSVRRFHDLGQTGWLILVFAVLSVIPLIGIFTAIGQLVWFCMRGTVGDNKYGPDAISGGYR